MKADAIAIFLRQLDRHMNRQGVDMIETVCGQMELVRLASWLRTKGLVPVVYCSMFHVL